MSSKKVSTPFILVLTMQNKGGDNAKKKRRAKNYIFKSTNLKNSSNKVSHYFCNQNFEEERRPCG